MKQRLFTIGHEALHLAEFLNKLTKVGVQTVVDVREIPRSRIRGFSKATLSAALHKKGIK